MASVLFEYGKLNLNSHRVGAGSRGVIRKAFSTDLISCDENISNYSIWNVMAFLEIQNIVTVPVQLKFHHADEVELADHEQALEVGVQVLVLSRSLC